MGRRAGQETKLSSNGTLSTIEEKMNNQVFLLHDGKTCPVFNEKGTRPKKFATMQKTQLSQRSARAGLKTLRVAQVLR